MGELFFMSIFDIIARKHVVTTKIPLKKSIELSVLRGSISTTIQQHQLPHQSPTHFSEPLFPQSTCNDGVRLDDSDVSIQDIDHYQNDDDDDNSCLQLEYPSQEWQTWEFHVVFSPIWDSFVLYFNVWDSTGTPLNLLTLCKYDQKLTKYLFGDLAISQEDHPVLSIPFYYLHPCQTNNFINEVIESSGKVFFFINVDFISKFIQLIIYMFACIM